MSELFRETLLDTPYEMGRQAVLSNDPEPVCPFDPHTPEYSEYAEGFCFRIQETMACLTIP